jgi:hypothetical protein
MIGLAKIVLEWTALFRWLSKCGLNPSQIKSACQNRIVQTSECERAAYIASARAMNPEGQ